MKKFIWKIDLVLISFSVITLLLLVGYARPLVISPINKYSSTDGKVLFLIKNANVILIDDNPDFTSPNKYIVNNGTEINLEPGKYYWEAVGVLGSKIRTLTIKSKVSFRLIKMGDDFGVVNDGNVGLNVAIYNGTKFIKKIKLGVGYEAKEKGTKFVGGWNE